MEFIAPLFNCAIPLFLIALGFFVGRAVEASHLRALDRRERELAGMVATNLRVPPAGFEHAHGALVSGSVVIGSDYFKAFAAGLRKIIGGEVRSYERMMMRARREALCRMLEDARARGANAVINVRYETSSIGGMMGPNAMPMAEVIAYGTALVSRRA